MKSDLRVAYRQLFADEGLLSERIEDVADQFPDVEAVMEIVKFMRAGRNASDTTKISEWIANLAFWPGAENCRAD